MIYRGACRCGDWAMRIAFAEPLATLNPRVCDCDYCKTQPSAVISHPSMRIELLGNEDLLVRDRNGDRLASFHRCASCGDLLAVGCEINGRMRGAANALLLEQQAELGERVLIQPRLLAAREKLLRWEKLWAELVVRDRRSIG